jgi:hypothetical protein
MKTLRRLQHTLLLRFVSMGGPEVISQGHGRRVSLRRSVPLSGDGTITARVISTNTSGCPGLLDGFCVLTLILDPALP